MQAQGHAQVICNLIDFGMDVQEAGDAARFRHFGSSEPTGQPAKGGGTVALESGISATVRSQLEAKGHKLVDAARHLRRLSGDPHRPGARRPLGRLRPAQGRRGHGLLKTQHSLNRTKEPVPNGGRAARRRRG